MSGSGTFAFTVHPRARLREDLARAWRPLGLLPDAFYDAALRRLPLPPIAIASARIGDAPVGHVVLVPFGARHLLSDVEGGRRRVAQAVDRAVALGADVVGLGALTATVTAGGATLGERSDIAVTNGNAFTAAIVEDQIRMLLPRVSERTARPHIAVVGATGSVGTAVTKLLARDPAGMRLTLIARTAPRVEALAAEVGADIEVSVAHRIDAVGAADMVVLLTASADALLGPEHVAPGAVVIDATQPRNTSPGLATARPDVLVVDGGIVSIPSLKITGADIGLPDGRSYACFAETAVLALTGHLGHFSLGSPTLDQVDAIRDRARALRHLGFQAAEPTSFGRPVDLEARTAVIA